MQKVRKLKIKDPKLEEKLNELASVSADLWNTICTWHWRTVDRQGHWLSQGAMMRWHCKGHPDFHSQTAQAVADQFYSSLKSWRARDRKGKPPMDREKEWNKICWKSQAIKLRSDGKLRLSNGRGNEPVLIDWPVDEEPIFVEIGWNQGFEVRATYKTEAEDRTTGDKIAGVDLGENHLAAVATKDNSFLLNGGKLRAIRKYQNQTKAKLQEKISRKERGSNQWKKLVKSKNKQLDHLNNKITDLLHKLSRKLIDMLLERGVSTVVIGKLKGIRGHIDHGRYLNQRIHQWAYGTFSDYIEYKAKENGIDVEYVDESYTSQTCPRCESADESNKTGRKFKCSECGYEAHRDSVGAWNIREKYVSEDVEDRTSSCLPGAMASPSGVRHEPHISCSSRSKDLCIASSS